MKSVFCIADANQAELRACKSRVNLSFDWLTSAVDFSNFGGNMKLHSKTVANCEKRVKIPVPVCFYNIKKKNYLDNNG